MELHANDLTFAEAYFLLKRKEESQSRTKRVERIIYVSSYVDLETAMLKIVRILEEGSAAGLKLIKSLLSTVTESFVLPASSWRDTNNLNILHYAIINNRPDVINYLLTDTVFFSKSHMPSLNPYAHLAALVGYKECLRIVLQNRPWDFFRISQPSHFLKLPDEIMKRLKMKETIKSNLMDKIKACTDTAEEELKTRVSQDMESAFFEESKKGPKKPFDKRRRSQPFLKTSKHDEVSTTPQKDKPKPSLQKVFDVKPIIHIETAKTDSALKKIEEEQRKELALRKRKMGKHVITVYWDVMSNDPGGIVKGAGLPAVVNFVNTLQVSRPCIMKEFDYKSKLYRPVSHGVRRSIGPAKRKSTEPALSSTMLSSDSPKPLVQNKRIEVGVRGKKKYKEFRIKIDHRETREPDEAQKFMNKTPLTIAAERGHLDCVKFLLEQVILKNNPMIASREPLTLATKARCPEAILLLVDKKMSRWDYQSAVLVAIRELFPDCLSALLSINGKERTSLFDGANLFHVLYSQSLIADYRYEMMPEMTRVLISCKENVNAHNVHRTFPMYTLISCAFNITVMKQMYYYIECLVLLLEAKANPQYSEERAEKDGVKNLGLSFTRKSYSSAINCILESAKTSLDYFEKPYWSKLFLKKFVMTVEYHDRTKRVPLNDVLFEYMKFAYILGLDRSVIKSLLRYGANPDFRKAGKFAINIYFDSILPYLTRFEVIDSYDRYEKELNNLLLICHSMTHRCLNDALKIFLDDHLLCTPIQALPICRYFSHLINEMVKSPRPLVEIASQAIWLCLGRNKFRAQSLGLTTEMYNLVVP
ncbi:unnamed protein product [Lymnaea stagnalis]|uniref:Uncharacterized protein n=1 Tax=Lymnaea stagnalis TaxID=6523 RepID=A0AAV2I5Y1_LYMST